MKKIFIALIIFHNSAYSMGKNWPGCCDRNGYYSSPNLCQLLADQALKKQRDYDELLSLVQSRVANNKSLDEPLTEDSSLTTPLHRAAVDDVYLPITLSLLEHNANPNKADDKGNTPLHFATKHISLDNIRVLLERNANPNISDKFERTPLYLICAAENDTGDGNKARKRVLAATFLVQAGANPNIKSLGETPLHALIGSPFHRYTFQAHLMNAKEYEIFMNNRKELIKLILDNGGDLSITNSRDLTPLQKINYHHPASSLENINDCKKLADFAVTYLNDSRKNLITRILLPNGSFKFSPFMKLPKKLVKMIVFMVYPSHKNKTAITQEK